VKLHNILFWVNGIALIVFLVVAILGSRRRKPVSPPNLTPYYDDETMEGPKLERFLGAAVIFSAILAAALPAYWLLEPTRQTKMDKDFLKSSIQRGRLRFAVAGTVPPSEVLNLECARCHGAKAEGGAATFLLQPTQPGDLDKTEANKMLVRSFVDDILVNGCNAISPEEVRGRLAADAASPYAGLDVGDLPEPIDQGGENPDGKINLKGTETYGGGEGDDE